MELCIFLFIHRWRGSMRHVCSRCLIAIVGFHLLMGGMWQHLIRRGSILKKIQSQLVICEVIMVKIKCVRWTRGLISIAHWRSNSEHQTTPLLYAQRDKILTLYCRLNWCDLKMTIRESTFNWSRWSKMKWRIQQSRLNFSVKSKCSSTEDLFLGFQANQIV